MRQGLKLCALVALVACSGPRKAEQMQAAVASAQRLQDSVVDFATTQRRWPSQLADLKVGGDELPGVSYAVNEGGMVSVWFRDGSALPGAVLRYTPTQQASGNVIWACKAEGVEAALKPSGCT
jgi:Pilin (bacterial filament)